MIMIKKKFKITLLVMLIIGVFSFFSSGLAAADEVTTDEIVFGFSGRTMGDIIHITFANTLQELAKKDGYKYFFSSADLDPAKQAADIEDMLSQGANTFVIVPQNKQQIIPSINKINEKGFPVISLECTPMGGIFLRVGPNSEELGHLSAEYVFSRIKGSGKVFFILGDPAHEHAINVTKGYYDILKNYPNIEVVAEQVAWWDTGQAMKIVEDLLLVYSDVDAILCNDDTMAIGVVEALKGAGYKPGEVLVGGGDGQKGALALIKEGWINCTVDMAARVQAVKAYETALAVKKGESVNCIYNISGAQIITELLLIDKANADTIEGY